MRSSAVNTLNLKAILILALQATACLQAISAQAVPQNESIAAAAQQQQSQADRSAARAELAAQMPVARLSHLAGAVSVAMEDGTAASVNAALNMPLVSGTRLLAGDNGEAEVEFPDGSVLRMTPGSTATLARLDPASQSTQLVLSNGLFYLELRASDAGSYAVAASDLTLSPEQNASFRVRVQDAQVETAVLSGTVSVTRANAYTTQVEAGESVRTDPKNGRRYLLAQTVSPEPWDNWNEKLAQAAQDEQGARTNARDGYAGEQGYGWADLDAGGRWYNVQGEGEVWQPSTADGSFDPYGNGSWVYGPGGYTWASAYGWGWLPYRCGAWSFYSGFGWGWSPASGCLTFGFGGGVDGGFDAGNGGGFRVRHPPAGWHPPRRPVVQGTGSGHPTLPVRYRPVDIAPGLPPQRAGAPVRIAGTVATPLQPVGKPITPQGGSAVGSSLLRDFPMRSGTNEPVLGAMPHGPVAVPGLPASWQRVGSGNGFSRGVAATGADHGAGRPASGVVGQGRLPRPTDPPINANGTPPLGANGAAPLGANGAPPLNANGLASPGRLGGATQGEMILRRGGSTVGTPREPSSPMLPGHGRSPAQGDISSPRPIAPAPVIPRMSVPSAPAVPRVSVPSAAPAAPHVAPAPAAVAPAAKPK